MSDQPGRNLVLYEALRKVPDKAQKEIKGGRLKGKTDINPMWRIKALTERFGPCGTGWKVVVVDRRMSQGAGEIAVFVDIELYYKLDDGSWSEPVPGTGGSMFVAREKDGPYTCDECYKMAYTDAISVSCKMLGMGADIYWGEDSDSKYQSPQSRAKAAPPPQPPAAPAKARKAAGAASDPNGIRGIPITFGKHKGSTLGHVLDTDRGYIQWLEENARETDLREACALLLGADDEAEPDGPPEAGDVPPFPDEDTSLPFDI